MSYENTTAPWTSGPEYELPVEGERCEFAGCKREYTHVIEGPEKRCELHSFVCRACHLTLGVELQAGDAETCQCCAPDVIHDCEACRQLREAERMPVIADMLAGAEDLWGAA